MANITIREIDLSDSTEKIVKTQPILTPDPIQEQEFIELDFGDEKVEEKS